MLRQTQKVRIELQALRTYATIRSSSAEGGSIKIDPIVYSSETIKPPTSKKSILHADYVSYYRNNSTMLILQHNNLTQQQLLKIRAELKTVGAKLRIIRVGIFEHAVRVAALQSHPETPAEQQALGPNTKSISRLAKKHKGLSGLDVTQLLAGPVCAITFPFPIESGGKTSTDAAVSPETLKKTISTIQATQNKLLLLGGKFEGQVFTNDSLTTISKLPGLDTLRGQLVSLLGAPAARLSQLLASPAQTLDRTLEGHKIGLTETVQKA